MGGTRNWAAAESQLAKITTKNSYKRSKNKGSITAQHRRQNNNYRKEQLAKANSSLVICPDKPVPPPTNQIVIHKALANIPAGKRKQRQFYQEEHQEFIKRKKQEQEAKDKEEPGVDNRGFDEFDDDKGEFLGSDNESHKSDDLGYNFGDNDGIG
jgi:hypothetical protein